MSGFKKMRIVRDDLYLPTDNQTNNIANFEKHQISVPLSRLSDLDLEINQILSSNIDEENKAKLYSQALRKYLVFKKLHKEESEIARQKDIQLLTKQLTPIQIARKRPVKKIKVKRTKRTIKLSKRNTKPITQSTPGTSVSRKEIGVGTRVKGKLPPSNFVDVLNAYKESNPEIFHYTDSDDYDDALASHTLWDKYGQSLSTA